MTAPGATPSGAELSCHAGRDGECSWRACPQLIEYQSHCPIDIDYDDWNQPEKADVARRDAFLLTPLGARVQELAAPVPIPPAPVQDTGSGWQAAVDAIARKLSADVDSQRAWIKGDETYRDAWRADAAELLSLPEVAALTQPGETT